MSNTEKVFVYGTLKVGGHFADDFDEFRVKSTPAALKGHALFNLGWFPTVVSSITKGSEVHGELHEYKHPDVVMRAFDRIEGYTGKSDTDLYDRKRVEVTTEDGEVHEAYIYVFAQKLPSDAQKIENGTWPLNGPRG